MHRTVTVISFRPLGGGTGVSCTVCVLLKYETLFIDSTDLFLALKRFTDALEGTGRHVTCKGVIR